ncbi:polymer-forming cytoskeletal protein [Myxococcus sp. AB025B]|uniref:polymer-forming cytoskeletal protein n=1 Tax=Myxococcus sp. AB025B TaxID=2562794 RepID=UPI00114409B8|nr:polymer-forming cytoskeletal protein [Myxococcus sp. AB025B]
MKISSRFLIPALLLGAPLALAESAPAARAAESAPAAKSIDVSFRGSLRDALKTIADKGGLNLVVTGDLDVPAEVHLRGISADQALRTVSRAYSLRMEQDGSIITLRPMTPSEKEAAAQGLAEPAPAVASQDPEHDEDSVTDAETMREVREQIREQMHRTRDELKRSRRSGARNVVARGQSLEVKEGQTVESAVVYGGNLVVKGNVEKDAVAFGGNLIVHGHVEGDAHAFGGNVVLKPGASVEGDVSSFGGNVDREDGANVEGSINTFGGANIGRVVAKELNKGLQESSDEGEERRRNRDDDDGGGLAGFILTFAVLFGLGFLGQMFFPSRMKQLGDEIRARPVQSGLTGLLGVVAMIPLTVVLAITIIGIPAALVLWMAAPLAAALGFAAVASELGTRLPVMRGRKTQAVVLALGLLVLLVVGAIPVFGAIVSCLVVLIALGAVIRTRFGYRPRGMGIPEPIHTHGEQPL